MADSRAKGLCSSLLGGESRSVALRGILLAITVFDFRSGEHTSQKTLAMSCDCAFDAQNFDQVCADTKSHEIVASTPFTIMLRQARTAVASVRADAPTPRRFRSAASAGLVPRRTAPLPA